MKLTGRSPARAQAGATLPGVTAPRPVRSRRPAPVLTLSAALLGSSLLGLAGARPVAIGGVVQSAAVGTQALPGGEMLPVWTLPRLGVTVRNDPVDVRLLLGTRELRYAPATGWRAVGFTLSAKLPAPQLTGGSLFVPLAALNALGLQLLADTPAWMIVGSNVVTPMGWKNALLSPAATVELRALSIEKRPVVGFLHGVPLGPVERMRARVSQIGRAHV